MCKQYIHFKKNKIHYAIFKANNKATFNSTDIDLNENIKTE